MEDRGQPAPRRQTEVRRLQSQLSAAPAPPKALRILNTVKVLTKYIRVSQGHSVIT